MHQATVECKRFKETLERRADAKSSSSTIYVIPRRQSKND
jgi:hypothetical protein